LDSARSSAEAIALLKERIVAVGSNEEISRLMGDGTTAIDLKGATVLPGFVDCHIHLIDYGLSLKNLDLRDVTSIDEMRKQVSEKSRDRPGWILGRGWDQERFVERKYPSKQDLDEVSPDKPVLLWRVCGHICVVNSLALKEAGIGAHTSDPEGGLIDRDANGEPTGILRENAVDLVQKAIPSPTKEDYEEAALAACQKASEAGLTTVHCIVSSQLQLSALLKLKAEGRLPLRFYVLIPAEQLNMAKQLGLRTGFGDEWVRIGGIKIISDGSLGARTAALEAPYSDDPLNRGVMIYSQEELDKIISEAHRYDFQIAAHAIGDRAIRMVLESFGKAVKWMSKKDLRHRIEHVSVLSPDLIRKLAESGVIASVQPRFVVSDFWVEKRLGAKRAEFTYPFMTLLRSGALVVAGSDCPVEPLTPLSGIAAAVHRPESEEALTVEDAIALYTRNASYASFEEDVKGTIAPGKCGDLVVLEKDPRKVPKSAIAQIRILMTMVGGKVVYRRDEFDSITGKIK
jgi:predicted amidohydrolase YtcJ